jgi:hypothetical protein
MFPILIPIFTSGFEKFSEKLLLGQDLTKANTRQTKTDINHPFHL